MTTGKTIALTRQTFVGKVMSLLFNMLFRLVINFQWEKITANETTDKRLIYKIYKQLIQFNARKTAQLKSRKNKKQKTNLNWHFSKEDYRWLTSKWKDAQHDSLLSSVQFGCSVVSDSLCVDVLSRLVITSLPRSKHLLISWLQSPSAVILEHKKIKSLTLFPLFPHLFSMKSWD